MTKVICEIGINHFGSIKVSRELINGAKEAGAWGIKFQYRNLQKYFLFKKKNEEIGKEIIDAELKKNYLNPKQIIYLSKYAASIGLNVGISFFHQDDVSDFKNYKFDFYKVPSVAALDFNLLNKLSRFKKKIFISLGAKSNDEIKKYKNDLIKNTNKSNTVFLHCVSNYPLNPINSNINFITKLKKIFKDYDIGYSSHENNIYNCIIALSKKINYIERHITLDKAAKGLDHSSSSDLLELRELCFYSRNYKQISYSGVNRNLNQGEKINLQNLGKSAYAKKDLEKNKLIKLQDIYFSPPKIGLDYNEIIKYLKKKNKKFLKKGDAITIENFTPPKRFSDSDKLFCNKKKLSLPIRYQDYFKINQNFQMNNYEFHLSYNDVLSFNVDNLDKKFLKNKVFSVHGPDYCNSNSILDIFSDNIKVKQRSFKIINKCIQICKNLKKISKNQVYLIQSFSSDDPNLDKKIRYRKIKEIINKYFKIHKIKILPQWLPPIAWYFGGFSEMKLFSSPEDFETINKYKIEICLDLSHFILSCNYNKKSLNIYFKKYNKLFRHFHIADASGIDGEGLEIGKGDLLKYKKIFKNIINSSKIKVLETWQGHLNDGLLFKKDIVKIKKLYL